MNLLSFIKHVGLFIFVFVTLFIIFESNKLDAQTKPNVLLIIADDLDEALFDQMLNLNLLPNIKSELKEKSIRFTNTFVTDSACCPSRASILTGKYPHNHEVKSVLSGNSISRSTAIKGAWEGFKPNESKTIAKWLKEDAGYTNGLIGKYFHEYGKNGNLRDNEKNMVFNAGWDMFKVIVLPPYNYKPNEYLTVQIEKGVSTEGPWLIHPPKTELNFISTQADYFIKKYAGQNPFFLMLTPISPHVTSVLSNIDGAHIAWQYRTETIQCITGGYQASDYPNGQCPNNSLRTNDTTPKSPELYPISLKSPAFGNFENNTPWNNNWSDINNDVNNANYKGMMRLHLDKMESMLSFDVMIGKVIKSLKDTNQLSNTVIIFTSDNGYLTGEHNLGNKIAPYEESIKVPLFVRYDKLVPNPGTNNTNIALNIDITPTILSLVGLNWEDSKYAVDGRPLNSAQLGSIWRKGFIVENWKMSANYWDFNDFIAYRNINKKFVEYFDDIDAKNNPIYGQYFDLIDDKYEINNKYNTIKANVLNYSRLTCLTKALYNCAGKTCREYDLIESLDCQPEIRDYDGNQVTDKKDGAVLAKSIFTQTPQNTNPKSILDLNTNKKIDIKDLLIFMD